MKNFFAIQNLVHVPRGPIWQMETPKNILNDYLHSYLEEQRQDNDSSVDSGEAFRILTTPLEESVLSKERRELASLALVSDKDVQRKQLTQHAKKYEWLEYGLQGKILPIEHFQKELEELKTEDPRQVLKRLRTEKARVVEKQNELISSLQIGKSHRKIFKIVRDSLFARLYSKFAQFYGYYALESVLKEVGSRYKLSLEETRYLSIKDFEEILMHKSRKGIDVAFRAQSHKAHSVQISEKGETKIWIEKGAEEVMRRIRWHEEKTEAKQSAEIKGQIAFKGEANGRVKIVNTVQEIAKMHKGNILVSHMTNPDIVPAMKMAAAIVTDLGGITCHAAIVARELRKPCIIGTKIATKVLKDGDLVEVDAN
ncbi:MAG: PEP-utilizing enzyme, partial [bacterium]|nr:PEP-utilizing enzyme [bacterium]